MIEDRIKRIKRRLRAAIRDGVGVVSINPSDYQALLDQLSIGEDADPSVTHDPAAAVYTFAAWLTCRHELVTASRNHDAAPWASLVDDFCKANDLPEPDMRRYKHPVESEDSE